MSMPHAAVTAEPGCSAAEPDLTAGPGPGRNGPDMNRQPVIAG